MYFLSRSDVRFFVADTQLYKRLCLSVRPSISPFVCWSVGPSAQVKKTSFLCIFWVCLCTCGALGCRWGLDAPPSHPQQYFDPTSLVYVSVFGRELGGALGTTDHVRSLDDLFGYVCWWRFMGCGIVDGGWMLLPSRPQRYWDPASLVAILKNFQKIELLLN